MSCPTRESERTTAPLLGAAPLPGPLQLLDPAPVPQSAVSVTLRDLSGGNVVATSPSGPVLRGRSSLHRTTRADTFVPLLRGGDRLVVATLTVGWVVSLAVFWLWWFQPTHRVSGVGLLANSALLLYLSITPVYYLVAANRLRQVEPSVGVPRLRVAFVVTRAPAEPWPVARTTLTAMLEQDLEYPYQVWLCDEQPTPEIYRWCRAHGVRVSSRHGVAAYQRPVWPRRARCKEGNLAYFYDHWGYREYDVVAQLDCDHVPHFTYLSEMLRPFADPAIGYVAAPSVCDANAAESWSARGRLHREASFHGPVQAGHTAGLAPVCIGSHYAVRTQALREIGGLGPELAEDFSTSFLLNSAGWQGAFALDAEAHGDGPLTFSAMLTQEFQWSRSLTTAMYDLLPRHLGRLPWRLRARFLYALTYYGLLAVTTVLGLALPPIAAVTGQPWVQVNYASFLAHWWGVSVWLLVLTLFLRRRGLLRPTSAPIVSWELWLYAFARWPFIALGVAAATVQKLRPKPLVLKVTPKARDGLEPLPVRVLLPYVALTVTLSTAAVVGELSADAAGYVFLCILAAACYGVLVVAVPVLHAVEAARAPSIPVRTAVAATAQGALLLGGSALLPLGAAVALYPGYASRVLGW